MPLIRPLNVCLKLALSIALFCSAKLVAAQMPECRSLFKAESLAIKK